MPPALRDRYRLGERLGSGGMADVHRATDTTLERLVAVKVLRETAGEESARSRFVHEARTLASLSHRSLVTVLDAGIGDDDDRPFLVMELVEGRTLSDLLADGPPPPAEVARIGAAVSDGLAYAHGRGVVHRDVKPANVLLSHEGRVKLADFGVARLLGDTVRHTRTGTAIGTAAYLSPEQVRGEDVTGAADVYALGLVLLEALTGVRAFPGSATESALARLQRDPDVPSDLPGGWATLLTSMTAREAAARPSAEEVARVLASGVPGDPATRTALLTAPVTTAVSPAAGGTAAAAAAPPALDRAGDVLAGLPGSLHRRWRDLAAHQRGVLAAALALAALLLVAALAGGAGTADPSRPSPTEPATSPVDLDPSTRQQPGATTGQQGGGSRGGPEEPGDGQRQEERLERQAEKREEKQERLEEKREEKRERLEEKRERAEYRRD